jgi:choline dehydrogenase-like flavoprotein
MRKKIEGNFPDRNLIISRTANLSEPQQVHLDLGRGKCQARNMCSRGCPFGAYFSTQSATLPAAAKTNNLTLLPNSVVHSIIYDDQKEKATGVRVFDALTKEMSEYYATIIFLNASTINSNLILLNSTSKRFPNGLGNDSGVLGHYLMAHNYRIKGTGIFDGLQDSYYYGRRPNYLYMPRFRNFNNDKQSGFSRGYAIAAGGERLGWNRDAENTAVGINLKEALTEPGPWQFWMQAMGEMLPYQDNKMWLDTDKKDAFGMPVIHLNVEWKENENAMAKDAMEQMQLMFEKSGFKNIHVEDTKQAPGKDIHEMGGARMGHDPKTSILNQWNQVHSCKNIFVTDGACMTSAACQNPSLTYMALTARAANYAVQELKKGNLK